MFNFHAGEVPKRLPSNPGTGSAGSTHFSNARENWSEHFDLVNLLKSVLESKGHMVRAESSWLSLANSDYLLLPQIVEVQPLEKGGVRTTTTIQANHSVLTLEGVFEFQHSTGNNLEDSFQSGFDQWAETDLVVLLDALRPKPETCTVLEMQFPEKDRTTTYSRRAVLGPVAHFLQNPQAAAKRNTSECDGIRGEKCESHEFCPCCLLTNSYDAFKELIEDRRFYGIRLYAMRDPNGASQADCRVNGNDWEKGAEALRKYVSTWPEAGLEVRKQYVVLHTI